MCEQFHVSTRLDEAGSPAGLSADAAHGTTGGTGRMGARGTGTDVVQGAHNWQFHGKLALARWRRTPAFTCELALHPMASVMVAFTDATEGEINDTVRRW